MILFVKPLLGIDYHSFQRAITGYQVAFDNARQAHSTDRDALRTVDTGL